MMAICLSLKYVNLGRMTHICVKTLGYRGSDNGLSPIQHQAIVGANAGVLFIASWEKEWMLNISRVDFLLLCYWVDMYNGWYYEMSFIVCDIIMGQTCTSLF